MPATPVDLATAISGALKEVTSLIHELFSTRDVRRLRYRVESATQYIFVDEGAGQYGKISEDARKKLKVHFRKRVFDES